MTHPDEILRELQRLSMLLEEQTAWHEDTAVEWAKADTLYVSEKAKARLVASGSNEDRRRGQVDQEVSGYYRQRQLAWAKHEAAKEKGRNLRAQLEALRSINANVRGQV